MNTTLTLARVLSALLLSVGTLASQVPIPEPDAGNRMFTAELARALAKSEDGNFVVSPLSIRLALAMAQLGATGATETELGDVIRARPTGDATGRAFAERLERLAKSTHTQLASSVWIDRTAPLLESYVERMRDELGSHAAPLDFRGDPDRARRTINAWIAHHTRDGIPELLAEGSIDRDTPAVLATALHFRARWHERFFERATHTRTFHAPDGELEAEFMRRTDHLAFHRADGCRAVSLSFEGRREAMTVFLPDEDSTVDDVLAAADAAWFARVFRELHGNYVRVALELPRFTIESRPDVKAALKSLGLERAFLDSATFDRMSEAPVKFADIVHAARIEIDERGAEASAATAVVLAPGSAASPGGPVPFVVDRPFFFTIRDIPTGTILFCGRCSKP